MVEPQPPPQPSPGPQPLNYADARGDVMRTRAIRRGVAVGVIGPIVSVPGVAVIGSVIDSAINKGREYSGLAGLVLGVFSGLGLVVLAAGMTLWMGRRRDRPFVRGLSIGLSIMAGCCLLGAGICFLGFR